MARPAPASARAVVIGLDGATWSLLDRLILEGVMPNLDRLRREGVHGPLWSVVPPMTATAWTSFQTGKGPGKHGVYDWTEPVAGTYLYRPIDSTRVLSKTIFELLSEAGRRVSTVNLPLTFPARPVNGVAVGDMLTPAKDTPGFLSPPSFRATLDQVSPNYQIDTHLCDSEADLLPFLERLRVLIEERGKLVRHLMEAEPWDLFACVWVEMDRMQHCLWHIFDPLHPRHDAALAAKFRERILDVYRLLDVRIGEMVERRPEGSNVFFISDHGFGHCRYKVFLNTWLHQEGFLTFKEGGREQRDRLRKVRGVLDRAGISTRKILDTARKLGGDALLRGAGDNLSRFAAEIDWEHTQAFCHGTNAIRINLRGREKHGSVDPAEFDEVVDRLKRRLEALTDPEGNRVISRVRRREELYKGPHVDLAADLLIADHDDSVWFYYSEGEVPTDVFEPSGWASGNHKPDGLFCAWGPDIRAGEHRDGTSINDITPTILALMDVHLPDDIDGEVLRDVVRPGRALRPRWTEAEAYVSAARESDAETDRQIEERLRGLGYLQ
ncbi:MAG: alkaline phosphatase family protein [Deltaproteobacteria bacterium]|nr:alkaline phosphatase family protein [Deltaproteobacteria bacterium]